MSDDVMGAPDGAEPSADSFVDNDAREFTRHLEKSSLPSFEEMRRNAYKLLGDAQQELYSDWRPDGAPNRKQLEAAREALRHITKAKQALIEATTFGRGEVA